MRLDGATRHGRVFTTCLTVANSSPSCSCSIAQGLGHEGEDLLNASLIIPLYKDTRGSAIRPIAVPSVHRKVLAGIPGGTPTRSW